MRVLVMGGSAFVGRAIVRRLRAESHSIAVLTRGLSIQDWTGVDHLVADRQDPGALGRVLHKRVFDAVIDVSAYDGRDCRLLLESLASPPTSYALISSAAVYAKTQCRLPFCESAPAIGDPIWGEYGIKKALAEAVVNVGATDAAYVFRPPYIYGPHNNLDRERLVWSRALSAEPVFVPGDGQTLIQMCHVDDLAEIVVRGAIHRSFAPGTYNVGEPSFLTFSQFVERTAEAAGCSVVQTPVTNSSFRAREYFPFRESHLILDTRKIAGVADYVFRPFSVGILESFNWWRREREGLVPPTPAELQLRDKPHTA